MDLARIKSFVREAHDEQKRKFTDEPYAVHPLRVGDRILEDQEDERLASTGYLHDVLEDTSQGPESIRNVANDQVLTIVQRLTHDPDYDHKVRAIAHSLEDYRDARLVKLYDRLDNVQDLEHASEEFTERYVRETGELLNWFENSGTNDREENLIGRIQTSLSRVSDKSFS